MLGVGSACLPLILCPLERSPGGLRIFNQACRYPLVLTAHTRSEWLTRIMHCVHKRGSCCPALSFAIERSASFAQGNRDDLDWAVHLLAIGLAQDYPADTLQGPQKPAEAKGHTPVDPGS